MSKELREAHNKLDKIVMKIYGFDESWSEEEIQVGLLEHYKFVTDYLKENNLKQLARQDSDDEEEWEDE